VSTQYSVSIAKYVDHLGINGTEQQKTHQGWFFSPGFSNPSYGRQRIQIFFATGGNTCAIFSAVWPPVAC